jgi:hypothetical protein
LKMVKKWMKIMWVKERWQSKKMWLAIINFNVHWSSISNGKSFKEQHYGPHLPPKWFAQDDHCSISFVITNNRFGLHFMWYEFNTMYNWQCLWLPS